MVEVTLLLEGRPRRVRLKLESSNRWGSSKDRTAVGLLDALEADGLLHRGATVVESTSGNLGVALAGLCRERGFGFVAVVDPRLSQANLRRLRELGAVVEIADEPDEQGGFLLARLRRVQELVRRDDHIWTNQYGNPANPGIHYAETGPELWQAADTCDAVFLPVSTGGTLAGVSRYLREAAPHVHVVAVDVVGSVALGFPPGPRQLTGIGSARRSEFVCPGDYDTAALITTAEAVAHCRALLAATGISVGGSSGAVLAACASVLSLHPECELAVCFCPDGGEKYFDTVYRDGWLPGDAPSAGAAFGYGGDVGLVSVPDPR